VRRQSGPVRRHRCAFTCQARAYHREVPYRRGWKDVFLMIDPAPSTRPKGETRLDVHNSNVNEDLAEAGLCGTVNLVTGEACRLPALHQDGCEFHRLTAPDVQRDEEAAPGP
jgi:hypothetical protein